MRVFSRLAKLFNPPTMARMVGVILLALISLVAGTEFGIFYDISVLGTWMSWFPKHSKAALTCYLWLLSLGTTLILWNNAAGKTRYKVLFAAAMMAPMSAIVWMRYNILVPFLDGSPWNFLEITFAPIVYGAAILLTLRALWRMTAPASIAAGAPGAGSEATIPEEPAADANPSERTDGDTRSFPTLELTAFLRRAAGS